MDTDAATSLRDFSSAVQTIFRYGADHSRRDKNLYQPAVRNEFFNDIYVSREEEGDEFSSFLNKDDTLILVGHVGIGKTTYIRHKIEHRRLCNAVVIDINEKKNRFALAGNGKAEDEGKDTPEDDKDRGKNTLTVLDEVISEALRNQMRLNIAYHMAQSAVRISLYKPIEDVTYEEKQPLPCCPDGSPYDLDDYSDDAELHLAALMLSRRSLFSRSWIKPLRRKYGRSIKPRTSSRKRYESYLRSLTSDPHNQNAYLEVLDPARCSDWIDLYRVLHPDATLCIVLDNADAIDIRNLPIDFFRAVVDISHEANRGHDAEVRHGVGLRDMRMVLAIRTENVALIRSKDSEDRHVVVFELDEKRYDYLTSRLLRTTRAFAGEVVARRLAALDNCPDLDQNVIATFRLIVSHWYDNAGKGLDSTVSGVDIFRLNNASLRMILEHIETAGLQLLHRCQEDGIGDERLTTEHAKTWLKGQVVRATWSHKSAGVFRSRMVLDLQAETEHYYLSRLRLLLTKILTSSNGQNGVYETPVSLYEALKRLFNDTTLEEVKERLWEMYEGNVSQCELIAIRQDSLVDSSADIQDDAYISIMPRGRELLESVLTHIDFYGAMIEPEEHSKVDPTRRTATLGEMMPERAAAYVGKVCRVVTQQMAVNYKHVWDHIISPELAKRTASKACSPFEAFAKDGFVVKNSFFINRVCDSHRNAIKWYIKEALRGKETSLLLAPDELDKLDKLAARVRHGWSRPDHQAWSDIHMYPPDTELGRLIGHLGKEHSFQKLWKACEQYEEALATFRYERQTEKRREPTRGGRWTCSTE